VTPQLLFSRFFLLFLFLGLFSCGEQRHSAHNYQIKGLDVSRYQGMINWAKVAKQCVDFVFVKASEGGDHHDEFFYPNWLELRFNGIRRGAYHFFRPEVSAAKEAANFFAQVGELREGDLPPVLDVEVRGRISNPELLAKIKEWMQLVEARYGMKPILYTGQKFYNRFLAGQFSDYPLWIARYNPEVPLLADGRDFQFWQFADRGKLKGIEGPVDVNIFAGSQADLEQLCSPSQLSDQSYSPIVRRK